MSKTDRLVKAEPLPDFVMRLTFANGRTALLDFKTAPAIQYHRERNGEGWRDCYIPQYEHLYDPKEFAKISATGGWLMFNDATDYDDVFIRKYAVSE